MTGELERMARVVGHEIRNPLATISNSVYFVKSKLAAAGLDDAKVAKHLGIIESQVKAADGVIELVLLYSKPVELAPQLQSLGGFLRSAAQGWALPEGVRLELEAEEGPRAKLDPERLGLALRQLVANAVEAMEGKGVLKAAARAEGGRAVLELSDTGPGFTAEAAEQGLAPFYTTRPRGVGLGLTVADKIVRAHGGTVELRKGAGGRVRFLLPLEKA